MNNYKLTVYLQIDSIETANAFASALSNTMPLTAKFAVELSENDSSHVTLGETTLESCAEFVPNS